MSDQPCTRILVADSHPGVNDALQTLFNAHADLMVVGQATHFTDLLAQIQQHRPDVVLLDGHLAGLPPQSALDDLQDLQALTPRPKIIGMSTWLGAAASPFFASVHGFISKTDPPEQVLRVVRAVALANLSSPPTSSPSDSPSD